jgi:MFS superfamily sulfate permease-like transporter
LLFLTPLLAPLPTVALGAIIIVASSGLIDLPAFRFLRQVRSAEFWLAVVTALGVLTVGVLQGILVAVVLSLVNVLYHIARPHDALLDELDAAGGTVYRGIADKASRARIDHLPFCPAGVQRSLLLTPGRMVANAGKG